MIGDVNNTLTTVGSSFTQVVSVAPVAFTEATNLVTLAAHGMPAGTPISFSIITTTTGITVGTQYFVANPTANTFQLATTLAAALAGTPVVDLLTGDGTGTIAPPASATSIDRLARHDFGGGRTPQFVTFTPIAPAAMHGGSTAAATTAATELFTTVAPHGLTAGTPVYISAVVTTTGLTLGQVYYVSALSLTATTFRLATTRALAMNGQSDVLLAGGDGTVTFGAIPSLDVQVIVSDNEDLSAPFEIVGCSGPIQQRHGLVCTFDSSAGVETVILPGHNLARGTPVVFSNAGGGLPAEVLPGVIYFVVPLSATAFRLATTYENAMAGTFILLSGNGTGTHTVQVRDQVLIAGGQPIIVDVNPRFAFYGRRYIGLRYNWTDGPVTTSQFVSKFTLDEFQKPVNHPFAYAIP